MWRSVRAAGVLTAVLSQGRPTLADSSTTSLRQGTAATAAGIQHSIQYASQSSTTYGKKAQSSFDNNPTAQQNKAQQQQQNQSQEPYPPSLKEGEHFAVLTANGTIASLSSIVKAVQQADVVILGEYHDDPVAHALELELLKRTAKALGYVAPFPRCSNTENQNNSSNSHQQQQGLQGAQQSSPGHVTQQQQQDHGKNPQPPLPQRPLLLSLEMFERDVQPVLDEYITGTASYADLLRDSRPWPNYKRDYHPLVEYCKSLAAVYNSISAQATGGDANSTAISAGVKSSTSGTSSSNTTRSNSVSSTGSSSGSIGVMPYIKVIAANAPRRYVSLAGRSGRQALLHLPAASRAYLAPLPYAQPSAAYTDKVQTSMRQAAVEMQRHRERERQHKKQQQQSEGKSMADQHSNSTSQQQQSMSAAAQGSIAQSCTAGTQQPKTPAGLVSTAAAATAAAGQGSGGEACACPYIGFNVSSNFLDAQCLWDATMAYAIAEQLHQYTSPCTAAAATAAMQGQGPEYTTRGLREAGRQTHLQPLIVHVCGKFHAESGLGIPEHVEVYAPGKRVLVVVFVPRDSMAVNEQQLEHEGLKGLADFVVLTDASLPRSFATVHPV